MAKQLCMQLDKTPKIVILCNGKFAIQAIQILGIEKMLCGIGVGDADASFVSLIHNECEHAQIQFNHFPSKDKVSELRSWLDKLQPDYIFSICFPFRVDRKALAYRENAFINFHTGPLPEFRGPMPIFEVLRYGKEDTAITVHYMSENFDEGPVIFEERIPIKNNDTFGSLALKLSEVCGYTAKNMAQMIQFGSLIPSFPQQDKEARYFEYPEKEDTQIRWNQMSAQEIEALIRACNPWNTGVEAILDNRPVRLLSASTTDLKHEVLPGQCLGLDEKRRLIVSCKENACIAINVLQIDKGFCSADEFFLSSRQISGKNPANTLIFSNLSK